MKSGSARISAVAFQPSISSGLTSIAAGRPFLVIRNSASLANTWSTSPLSFALASARGIVFILLTSLRTSGSGRKFAASGSTFVAP